jgi:hypothetical protein
LLLVLLIGLIEIALVSGLLRTILESAGFYSL